MRLLSIPAVLGIRRPMTRLNGLSHSAATSKHTWPSVSRTILTRASLRRVALGASTFFKYWGLNAGAWNYVLIDFINPEDRHFIYRR